MKTMYSGMKNICRRSDTVWPAPNQGGVDFGICPMQRADRYHHFLSEIIDSDGDMEKLRQIVIENRSLVFDDHDFGIFAQSKIQESESAGDSNGALHWRWLLEFVINTICFYD